MEKRIDILFDKYISHKASDLEREEILKWISEDNELQLWLEEKFASSTDALDEKLKANILSNIHSQIVPQRKTIKFWSILQKIAAIFLLPLLTAVVILVTHNDKVPVQYCTIEAQKGQKTNVTLPDGSRVYLNSESRLTYATNFNQKDRRLRLTGEAYFEVAKNKKSPFIVNAGNITIRALGTAFNVRAYSNEKYVSATLADGSVRVTSSKQTIDLIPNEQVDMNNGNGDLSVIKLDDAHASIGWLNNKMHFNNCTFAEVAASLSRIYNIDILLTSESLKKQRFSGTINNNSIESVLRILSFSAPVRYELRNGKVEIYEILAEKKYYKQ